MNRHSRLGLTLIELLVVMAIMGILGGIVAVVAPKFAQSSRVAEGSREFASWLAIARQRAQRDNAPRGIRFAGTLQTSTPQKQEFYSTFVFVEQPEDLWVTCKEIAPNRQLAFRSQAYSNLQFGIADMTGKYSSAKKQKFTQYQQDLLNPAKSTFPYSESWRLFLWFDRNLSVPPGTPAANLIIRHGDIVLFGSAKYSVVYEPIAAPAASGGGSFVILDRFRDDYREYSTTLPGAQFVRAPRQIAGEAELSLPRDVAVDILWTGPGAPFTRTLPAPSAPAGSQFFDVMFAPSGEVVGSAGTNGRLVFWLRDTSLKDNGPGTLPEGDNRLIVVHCRTGQITSHPVSPDATGALNDPYQFVRDGKSSANED